MDHQHTYKRINKRSRSSNKIHKRVHRFEHWLIDNQVYVITSTVRDHQPAFAERAARDVFWDRFAHYTKTHGFVPWVTSLMTTHYHTLGYFKVADGLPTMMQRLHGSVAKLTNDLLPTRIERFWRTKAGHEYFDGCIRNEKQARLAYRYTLLQSVRARVVKDHTLYPDTRVNVGLERAIKRALELDAFLEGVPYRRYEKRP